MTASMTAGPRLQAHNRPILLFNDECGLCRRIARWVQRSGTRNQREATLEERPIGADPQALWALHPGLDIWEAYATIHLLMPDGSMKTGGEAVAEVFRGLPSTAWLAKILNVSVFGARPFQGVLNLAYRILSDIRPFFGCESCGTPSVWVRPLAGVARWRRRTFGGGQKPHPSRHFSAIQKPGVATPVSVQHPHQGQS